MTEKEKAKAGYLYNANYDSEIVNEIEKCTDLCYEYNQIKPSDEENKNRLLKQIIGNLGENAKVTAPFWCDFGYNLYIGDFFYSNHNLVITDGAKVEIGDHVFIAPNVCITTAEHAIDAEQRNAGLEVANHPLVAEERNQGLEQARPITIGDNVWIGAGTVILGGAEIGDNSVIGAGSVVKKDIPPNVIAVGVPCRPIRQITEEDKKRYPQYPKDNI